MIKKCSGCGKRFDEDDGVIFDDGTFLCYDCAEDNFVNEVLKNRGK